MDKKFKLENLELDEISFVPEGANEKAKVQILKIAHEGEDYKKAHSGKEDYNMEISIQKCLDIESVIRKQWQEKPFEKGMITKPEAENLLDEMAQAMMINDPSMSAERAFVLAMEKLPSVAAISIGNTTSPGS